MSTLEPLASTTGALPWVVWEPLTPGDLLTVTLGLIALTLAAYGLSMMNNATAARDAQTRMMDERTATLIEGMRTVTISLEAVIRQTAPGAGGEPA